MGLINLKYTMSQVQGKFKHLSLSVAEFSKFNSKVLGLGNISKRGKHVDSLVAIFDLEGFTSFCNQSDPLLVVPDYLDQLLTWLFWRVGESFRKETRDDDVILWGKFPFFAKFLGDGILFMWDTTGLGQASLGNIIINLCRTCAAYSNEFLPEAAKQFLKVPPKLRCGVARGQVISIGGGKDFVGPCINEASRLQKLSHLSFAFSRRGLHPEQCFSEIWQEQFVVKRILIRGMDEEQLILILREEYDKLSPEEQAFFREP